MSRKVEGARAPDNSAAAAVLSGSSPDVFDALRSLMPTAEVHVQDWCWNAPFQHRAKMANDNMSSTAMGCHIHGKSL
jgi:hypothetical protein